MIPETGKRKWALSRMRPVTLLIACGIILAAAILIVTGLVAGYLREQALAASEHGLTRLDAVLAETGDQVLHAADSVLSDLDNRLNRPGAAAIAEIGRTMAAPETGVLLDRLIEFTPQIGAVALLGPDGVTVRQAGAWPLGQSDAATRDFFAALRTRPELDASVGTPFKTEPGAGLVIPFARKLRSDRGEFAGVVVVTVPASTFEQTYRAVPLGSDGAILLLRRDGVVLAQYPPQPDAIGKPITDPRLVAALADGGGAMIEQDRSADREWRIAALRAFAGHPITVLVSRSGDQALVGWARQAAMFGAFAVCGVIAIWLMVYLISRQFRTHSALAAIRAEKIEAERARLSAEAELLKKERLSVLGQFTATVADELRNPLSAIRNSVYAIRELIAGRGLPLDRPLTRIERSIGRCDGIVTDLLDYARSRQLNSVPQVLDQWLGEVLDEQKLPDHVTLMRDLAAPGVVVAFDPDRLRRVVVNLVENAAQSVPETERERRTLEISI
ncbi:MAG TPA: histidine kinase dimerization/phospho-acceptor domain-containing protein, partial [Stellaceae bacterium]|nr:histidine kinase dimerization/phospho-acceptor domain-containing protein [Stellaceae bacterium]